MPLNTGGFAGSVAGSVGADYGTRSGASGYNSNRTNDKKKKTVQDHWDELSFWDRFGVGGLVASPLGPAGSLLTGTMMGLTAYADPEGSVDAPFGSVSDGGSGRNRALGPGPLADVPAEAPPPLLGPEPSFAAIEKEKRRKRFGRQQTIKTGGLGSGADVNKPTLLGS